MKRTLVILTVCLSLSAAGAEAQTTAGPDSVRGSRMSAESRTFFPRNWIRGYSDFEVAPSHNEPDLGRCMFPPPTRAGVASSQVQPNARNRFTGSIKFQLRG